MRNEKRENKRLEVEAYLKSRGFVSLSSGEAGLHFFGASIHNSSESGFGLVVLIWEDGSSREEKIRRIHTIYENVKDSKQETIYLLGILFSEDQAEEWTMDSFPCWILDFSRKELKGSNSAPRDLAGMREHVREILVNDQVVYQEVKKEKPKATKTNDFNTRKQAIRRLQYQPYMTILLMALNILYFLFLEIIGDTRGESQESLMFMLDYGADYWVNVFENGELYRLFTSMFIHFGIEHLAGNMLALYIFGKIAEGAVGHVRYLIFYLVSGLGASLCSCVFNMLHDTNTISGGASGAIYGVMGMVLAMLIVSSKRSATMEVLKVRMGIMVVFMVFDGMSMAGVDWVAHLGGLVVGLLVTLAFRDRKRKLF